MSVFQKVQQVADATPTSVNTTILFGGLLASILQPLAVLVTIVWGGLQIYLAVEKRWGFSWLKRFFKKD